MHRQGVLDKLLALPLFEETRSFQEKLHGMLKSLTRHLQLECNKKGLIEAARMLSVLREDSLEPLGVLSKTKAQDWTARQKKL